MSDQPDPTIEPATDPVPADGSAAEPTGELQHVTVAADDEIAVCTMFPQGVARNEAASKWLTATGDAFVSLEAYR